MIKLILLGAVLALPVAAGQEVGVNYLRVNQDLFGTIKFPMDVLELSYTYLHPSGFGLTLAAGKSYNTTQNSLEVEDLQYSNTINAMYGASIFYRYQLSTNWDVEIGIGQTDYKSTWYVNGKVPEWGDNTSDSDKSYHVKFHYHLQGNWYGTLGYSDLYRKDKSGYGREATKAFGIGLNYRW